MMNVFKIWFANPDGEIVSIEYREVEEMHIRPGHACKWAEDLEPNTMYLQLYFEDDTTATFKLDDIIRFRGW